MSIDYRRSFYRIFNALDRQRNIEMNTNRDKRGDDRRDKHKDKHTETVGLIKVDNFSD